MKETVFGFIGVVLLILLSVYLHTLNPFEIADINLLDQSIRHPSLATIVPIFAVYMLFAALPTLLVLLFNFLSKIRIKQSLIFIQTIAYAHLITNFIVELLKVWTGKLRPDFLARCFGDNIPTSIGNRTIISAKDCTSNDLQLIKGGRESFPSGHTSTSFVGATIFALWLVCILNRKMRKTIMKTQGLIVFIAVLPLMGAAYVGVSRIEQYAHHPIDVLVGGLIGVVISSVIFSSYYNALFPVPVEGNEDPEYTGV